MLIDNKTQFNNPKYITLYQFLKDKIGDGNFNIVSAYFTINMLAKAYEELNQPTFIRAVFAHLVKGEESKENPLDLLIDDLSIDKVIELSNNAKKAVKFLEQEKVSIKTFHKDFCHAKAYIYQDKKIDNNSFYVLGSSNFTEAGLGANSYQKNIELNEAQTGESNLNMQMMFRWMEELWNNTEIKEKVEVDVFNAENNKIEKKQILFKKYLIELVEKIYKEYTPNQIYYKILYELFKEDILEIQNSVRNLTKKDLEQTLIWNNLYDFQKQGVLSLINKIQKYNGAILADAVGLGKTWQALAIMKFFEVEGYNIVLICPKKLKNNWQKYLKNNFSIFEDDEFDFKILHHTDLSEERLKNLNNTDFIQFFQRKRKVFLVIDESHNLRNDKSARYQTLINSLLNTEKEVKTLLLSATPINNNINDLRNQVSIIAKGKNDGFKENEKLKINSLKYIFAQAQSKINEWTTLEKEQKTLDNLLKILPQDFLGISDALIVARTRRTIAKTYPNFKFPQREKTENIYVEPKDFGTLKTSGDILEALNFGLYAYRSAEFTDIKWEEKKVTENEKQRQGFLVKMMYILLIKRLESSWWAFKKTAENILTHHQNALNKVSLFIEGKSTNNENLDEDFNNFDEDSQEEIDLDNLSIGKKRPILLKDIAKITEFKKELNKDVESIKHLTSCFQDFEKEFNQGTRKDEKLEKLIKIITEKQNQQNKKILIFTAYSDTAEYLFEQIQKRNIAKTALITGKTKLTEFEENLEKFAPYTKLFIEKDWKDLYQKNQINELNKNQDNYKDWKDFIKKYDQKTHQKIENEINILIATDCLSEGQNLQDCDLVVNYDIHWNPVRLIQRFGRIDRLGSPNATIKDINFWIGNKYEDYLNLKKRVEERMKLMAITGAEVPIVSEKEADMLEKISQNVSWEDIERQSNNLSLSDLTMDNFRQELTKFLELNSKEHTEMPNGTFSGFQFQNDLFPTLKNLKGVVALLKHKKTKEIKLIHINSEGKIIFQNHPNILDFLSKHKEEKRFVPQQIDKGEQKILQETKELLKKWFQLQIVEEDNETGKETAGKQTQMSLDNLQGKKGAISNQTIQQNANVNLNELESQNFDLLVWETIN